MIRFLGRTFFMVLLLFFGVLFGIQLSNDGIRDLKGSDEAFTVPFSLSEDHSQATVLGETVTTHSLQQKQEKLREIGAFNLFSSIGETVSRYVKELFQTVIHSLVASLT